MDDQLKGNVAVVTAGSTGFGRGIAVLLARHGARVAIGDIREDTTPGNFDERPELTTAQLIAESGGEAAYFQCDVTQQQQVAALVHGAVDRFGRLDIMVNNAGVYRGGRPMHELTEADLDACWNVLVKGSWFGTQEALKVFLRQGTGGNIINIVSTAGLRAHHAQTPYNMAKAAQANLTRCIAIDYARHGVRANAICPTYMKTAMSRGAVDNGDTSRGIEQLIPLGRWGEVSDVANLALFLASDASAFINGALIPLDGGETAGLFRPTIAPSPDP
jgi:NAD(P)-dependent dehydrogenase (short-subunit alcohol dehydrogenase family)